MDLKTLKNKPVHITTAVALITGMSTGGYEMYTIAHEILNSYATKDDIIELKRDTENVRRSLSLDLLDSVIMTYEDKLVLLDFEIINAPDDLSLAPTKKTVERRLDDLRQRRQIIRQEISNTEISNTEIQ